MPAYGLPLEAAYVVIVAVTGAVWVLQTWSIRIFIRLNIHGPLGWDDFFCTLATCLAIIHSSLAILGTRYGMGRRLNTLDPATINLQQMVAWINNQLYIAALTFSMLSVCFLIVRVTQRTQQARLAYAIVALIVLWAVVSMPVLALDCALPRPWKSRPRSRCTNIYHIWLAVTITNTLLEICITLATVKLLWGVRMALRAKAAVVTAFIIRLLVIPPSITRLRYIHQTLHSTDWSYSRIRVVIITQVVLYVSVILATVPCIKPWLVAFESGGLQAPPDVRKESAALRRTPLPSPCLPLAAPAPVVTASTRPRELKRFKSSDDAVTTVLDAGPAGHRKRVEAWPLQTYRPKATYAVIAEHVPIEESHTPGRKRSASSAKSEGIVRTKSFSVQHDDIGDYFSSRALDVGTPSRMQEGVAESVPLGDPGGLLRDDARGSKGTVMTLRTTEMLRGMEGGKGKGRADT